MIQQLTIRNIALIEALSLSLQEGLNILTGETGAGKSILIDAVNLVLGERADRELIQTGAESAQVEILCTLPPGNPAHALLKEYGIEPEEDGSLLLMRELTLQGRNTCRINGRSVTLSMLREVSRHVVDIHGQHQHQSLLVPDSHREVLDRLGGQSIAGIKEALAVEYAEYRRVQREIQAITGGTRDAERRKDLLRYQIQEIEGAALTPGEEDALLKERSLLQNGEKIRSTAEACYQILYTGSKGAPAAVDALGTVLSKLESIQHLDPGLSGIYDQLMNVQALLEEAVLDLRAFKEDFVYDPERLEQIEARLERIRSLKRKYGGTLEEILACKTALIQELFDLENSEERLHALNQQFDRLANRLLTRCRALSEAREQAAEALKQGLLSELSQLNMDKLRFAVHMHRPGWEDEKGQDTALKDITAQGYDRVEFLMSPNPGEPLKPLAKIASGGELSRIMLALKTILGDNDQIPTLIFDEIDVGISGRTAAKVAEKMGGISRGRQILCVTHLPQIAAMADSHYLIYKESKDDQTRTYIRRLPPSERQAELARMAGGEALTELSLQHAQALIDEACQFKEKQSSTI